MWDNEITFSTSQAFVAGGETSDNIIDSGGDDMGLGGSLVLQAAVSGAPATELVIRLDTADAEAMADAVALATFKVAADRVKRGGVVLAAPLPTGCRRYLRLHYSGPVTGKITAGLVQAAQTNGM